MAEKPRKLTNKQKKFIREYLIDLNATQAAIRAGYSPKTAKVIATQNLSKLYIKNEIEKQQLKLQEKTEITQERVLQEEKCLAFSDPAELFELKTGTIKAPYELPEELRRAISIVEITESFDKDGIPTKTYKYRFWDKGKSLERISKHLGLYEKDNKRTVDIPDREWKLIVKDAGTNDSKETSPPVDKEKKH